MEVGADTPTLEEHLLKSRAEGVSSSERHDQAQMGRNPGSHQVSVVQRARLDDHSAPFWLLNPQNCVHFHFNETALSMSSL